MATRPFRGEDSYIAERITRDMVKPFLEQKGYTNVEDIRVRHGNNESQSIVAVDPSGEAVRMHVQSCWRRDGQSPRERLYSAAQLMSEVKDDDWENSIRNKLARSENHGVTHSLFVQREDAQFVFAACVPLAAVWPIWEEQRRISDRLQSAGVLGRQKKNHATNGKSPTIWLQDNRTPKAHEVADALWNFSGVVDLVELSDVRTDPDRIDDSFDDCVVDYEQLGADGAPKVLRVCSMVKRDRRVRAAVLSRAEGKCERLGCEEWRVWPGFLDVHHILGADKSDRVWNCVALCPSCHREAHFAPDRDALNAELLRYASGYRKSEAAEG